MQDAPHPATVPAGLPATLEAPLPVRRRNHALAADMGAATAMAIDLGLVAVMIGSFLTGISSHTFLGSSLVSEFGRGFRFRLLAVFSQASFEQAIVVLLAVLLTAAVPTDQPSSLRRPALYVAS